MSMSTRKRQRRELDSSENSCPGDESASSGNGASEEQRRIRDEEFWFEDGSIVLVARDVEFRVYKGILASRSPVFRDMFSLPQPQDVSSSSVPVVQLADSPEDIRHFLRICLPNGTSNPFLSDKPSPHVLIATVRLAHKYQVADLLDSAVKFLGIYYPKDLPDWSPSKTSGRYYGLFAIVVVNIARLLEEYSLLPFAIAMCCEIGAEIVDGFQHEDGSRETLRPADLGLCFAAKSKLAAAGAEASLRISLNPPTVVTCKTKEPCRRAFRKLRLDLPKNSKALCCTDLTEQCGFALDNLEDPLCGECFEEVERCVTKEREAIWKKLPKLLGIVVDDWAEGQVHDNTAS